MSPLTYHLVDVFTNVPFGGNQLAVFDDARDVPPFLMPQVAKELNLSETTFVLPPTQPLCTHRVRIFTPARELPFAGHPTIGTAFVLSALEGGAESRFVFEEGVGAITVTCAPDANGKMLTRMSQPLPHFAAAHGSTEDLAGALSLDQRDLALGSAPVEIGSSGNPFLFVPLRSRDALARIRVRGDLFEKVLSSDAHGMVVWTTDVERPGSHVRARMFAPRLGIVEDPATGSANGPLAVYLLRHRIVKATRIVTEQGFEMGRPSILVADLELDRDAVSAVHVGGECVAIGRGVIEIAA